MARSVGAFSFFTLYHNHSTTNKKKDVARNGEKRKGKKKSKQHIPFSHVERKLRGKSLQRREGKKKRRRSRRGHGEKQSPAFLNVKEERVEKRERTPRKTRKSSQFH